MKQARRFALGAALAVCGVGFGAAQAQDYVPPKGDAHAGEALFQRFGCYSCHGSWGQGTGRDGARINPPPAFPAVLQQLRMPRQEMPPYVVSEIPDQGVADIYAYLSNIPKPPDPKTIKALR